MEPVFAQERTLGLILSMLQPADVAAAARSCKALARAARRDQVWESRWPVAERLAPAAGSHPFVDEGRRLRGVREGRMAREVFGVHAAWASPTRPPAAAVARGAASSKLPAHGTSVCCALLPDDAPWMRAALGPAAPGTSPRGCGLVAAALFAFPKAVVFTRPSPAGQDAQVAFLPILPPSARSIAVADMSHSHIVFAHPAHRRPDEGPSLAVLDLARVPPGDFVHGTSVPLSANGKDLPPEGRLHKSIPLVPRSLRGAPAAAMAVADAAISSVCLLRRRARSAGDALPALAAVGTFGRTTVSNAVFVLDVEAGTSLRAMWGQPGGVNTLSMTYTPAEERWLGAWREGLGAHGAGEAEAPWSVWAGDGEGAAVGTDAAAEAWLDSRLDSLAEPAEREAALLGGGARGEGGEPHPGAGDPGATPWGLVEQPVRPRAGPEGAPGRADRDEVALLRGLVVAAGDRAGCVAVYRCDRGQPAVLRRVSPSQVLGVSVDGASGAVAVLNWEERTVTLRCGRTLAPLRVLAPGGVTKMDADWDSGVMVVRGVAEDPDEAADLRVLSLWHQEGGGEVAAGGSGAAAGAAGEPDAAAAAASATAEPAGDATAAGPTARVLRVLPPSLPEQAATGVIAIRGDKLAFTAHFEPGAADAGAKLCTASVGVARAEAEADAGAAGKSCAVM